MKIIWLEAYSTAADAEDQQYMAQKMHANKPKPSNGTVPDEQILEETEAHMANGKQVVRQDSVVNAIDRSSSLLYLVPVV